jgi:hypothetical protein
LIILAIYCTDLVDRVAGELMLKSITKAVCVTTGKPVVIDTVDDVLPAICMQLSDEKSKI